MDSSRTLCAFSRYGDDEPVATLRPTSPPKIRPGRGPSIAERSAQWERKRQAKEQATRAALEREASAKCSFTPKVSAKAKQVKGARKPIHQRNDEWARRKEQKLDAERRVRELTELAECTFQPNQSTVAAPRNSPSADDDSSSGSVSRATSHEYGHQNDHQNQEVDDYQHRPGGCMNLHSHPCTLKRMN